MEIDRSDTDPWQVEKGTYSSLMKRKQHFVYRITKTGKAYHPQFVYEKGKKFLVEAELHVHLTDEGRDAWIVRELGFDSLEEAVSALQAFDISYYDTVLDMTYAEAFPPKPLSQWDLFDEMYRHPEEAVPTTSFAALEKEAQGFLDDDEEIDFDDIDRRMDAHLAGEHKKRRDPLCPSCQLAA